jgi:hypothetical protein
LQEVEVEVAAEAAELLAAAAVLAVIEQVVKE